MKYPDKAGASGCRAESYHATPATGTNVQGSAGEPQVLLAIVGGGRDRLRRRRGEQASASGELGGAMAIGEKAIVANAMEGVGQRVQQEPADELVGRQGHDLDLVLMAVIFPAKGDLIVLDGDEAAVGDGDAVGRRAR